MIVMNARELRIQAGLSRRDLAVMADVAERTIVRMEDGAPIRDYIAQRILDVLSGILLTKGKIERKLTSTDVDGLKIA